MTNTTYFQPWTTCLFSYRYKPNVFADLQLAMAEYSHVCLASGSGCKTINDAAMKKILEGSTISHTLTKWAKGEFTWDHVNEDYHIVRVVLFRTHSWLD